MALATRATLPTAFVTARSTLPGGVACTTAANKTVAATVGALQTAINAAVDDDIIDVAPNFNFGSITLPSRGTSGWVTLRSADFASIPAGSRIVPGTDHTHLVIVSTIRDDTAAIAVTGHGWRLIGFAVYQSDPTLNLNHRGIEGTGSRCSFERCYIPGAASHAGAGDAAIRSTLAFSWGGSGFNVQVWDSWIVGRSFAGQCGDGAAVILNHGGGAGGPYHFENNEIQGTGQSVLLSDQAASVPVTDATFRRNHHFKPLYWKAGHATFNNVFWTVKEIFEIKWANRVLIDGDIMENNWGGQGQDGTASLFRIGGGWLTYAPGAVRWNGTIEPPANQGGGFSRGAHGPSAIGAAPPTCDITLRYCTYSNTPYAWGVDQFFPSAADAVYYLGLNMVPYGQGGVVPRCERITIHDCLCIGVGGRIMSLSNGSDDVTLEHCTGVDMAGSNVGLPQGTLRALVASGVILNRLTVRYNAFGWAALGPVVYINDANQGLNGGWNTVAPDRTFSLNAIHRAGFGYWLFSTAEWRMFGDPDTAGVNQTTGALSPTSPLKVGQAGYFGVDGKDIGVDFVALLEAQGGDSPEPEPPVAPVITGEYDPGETSVTGTGINGAAVQVYINAVAVSGTVTVSSGTWAKTVPTLQAGSIITATQTTAGGTSPLSDPALMPPNAPTVTSTPYRAGDVHVTGSSLANATIEVYVNAISAGTTMATSGGTWDVAVTTLVEDDEITATQTMAAGTSAPSSPVVVLAAIVPEPEPEETLEETWDIANVAGLDGVLDWDPYLGEGNLSIVSNALRVAGGSFSVNGGRLLQTMASPNQRASVYIDTWPTVAVNTFAVIGPCVRMQNTGARTFYTMILLTVDGEHTCYLSRWLNAVATNLGMFAPSAPFTGTKLSVSAQRIGDATGPSLIRGWIDDVEVMAALDDEIPTGDFVGLQGVSSESGQNIFLSRSTFEVIPPAQYRPPIASAPATTTRPLSTFRPTVSTRVLTFAAPTV